MECARQQSESATAPSHADNELAQLLTDRRLIRVNKALVYSHIVGKASGFLSHCCIDELCPHGRPFGVVDSGESDVDEGDDNVDSGDAEGDAGDDNVDDEGEADYA